MSLTIRSGISSISERSLRASLPFSAVNTLHRLNSNVIFIYFKTSGLSSTKRIKGLMFNTSFNLI